ncbi:MAG: hypothetical protein QM778_36540 [Myxococcales bacterium]
MHDLIVMGIGELGQLYATAALKRGMRVIPVTRAARPEVALQGIPLDTPLLVAVGEADLEPALESLPKPRLDSIILLQNELFPSLWQRFSERATVMVPWLLKKKGEPLLVARSTPVYGQFAELAQALHESLGFAVDRLPDMAALEQAIVDKYAFILSVNALGLMRDIRLGEWLKDGPQEVQVLAREAAVLGSRLVSEGARSPSNQPIDLNQTVAQVHAGMLHMAGMRAKGRTAPDRVRRALEHAGRFRLNTPALLQASRSSG